jgi:amino acid adenylation domain-containing protein
MRANTSPENSTYRLTPIQQGMLFHCLASPGSGIDVEQVIGELREPLSLPAFRRAWQRLVDRHEALRMRFILDASGRARQYTLEQITLPIEEQDWSGQPAAEQQRQLEDYLLHDRLRSFDPRVDLPTRVAVFRLGAADYRFVWTWWHGILDGRANLILLRELFSFYEAFRRGEDLNLPLPRRYTDYTEWLAGCETASAASYWKQLLAGFTEPTPIGADGRFATPSGEACHWHEMRLPAADSAKLRAAAEAWGVTMNTFVQGAWALVLGQFSRRDDVVFGATRACRYAAFDADGSAQGIVGALINTVPVRARLGPETRVRDLLQDLRAQQVAVRPYEHSPLVEVQAASEVPADRRLFDSIVAYENQFLDSILRAEGGVWESRHFDIRGQTGYRATLYVYGEPEMLLGVSNDPAALDDQTAQRMLAHTARALECLAADPETRLADLPLLLDRERSLLLYEWNRTDSPFPRDASIPQCFAEQAALTPDAPALTCRGRTWTYAELDRRAEQVAGCLREAGARPETIVAICMDRSLDLVAGMLGILKAGAAYLPLDPTYPSDRLAFILEDARPLLTLANRNTRDRLPAAAVPILSIDSLPSSGCSAPGEPAAGHHLAYVIYTSGSTGTPKGVMVEHRNVMNLFAGMDAVYGREPAVWLAVTSVSFDVSVLELWWTLTRGGHVVFWPGLEQQDSSLPDLMRAHGVTHIATVPSFVRMLLPLPGGADALAALRILTVGGEVLSPALIRDLGPSHSRRIINAYGPTETTVLSTCWEVDPRAASISIGRPIANTRLYVLDAERRPVPVGVVGELYIGGSGVARGYLNRPGLTAGKFISDPFSSAAGSRLYRTGDLVRYRQDGALEFAGRIDQQVKIRGHRVELEGIETVLASHPGVRAAAVDLQERTGGGKRLVAYVVPGAEGMPSPRELREQLREKLPAYMVPAVFVRLDALPLTPNGKLNRGALPAPGPDAREPDAEHRLPTPLEAALAKLWRDTLNRAQVGLDENFFDLGGDSLEAVRLLVAIHRRFGVELPPQVLFQAPTVAQLAGRLALAIGAAQPAPTASPDGAALPRTATERRLLAIWEDLLDIRPIGIRDSFFNLCGDALLFERMLAEIRAAFGVFAEGFPVRAVIDNPTIEALARIVDDNIQAAESSLAVCLQPLGSGPPVFLIHAGGGYVFFYRALASRLGPHRPVYGVRAETRSDGMGLPYHRTRSVEELAARYIEEIRTIQPHGPYSLGGACFGGVVAFEMARMLRAQGEAVGPVFLFDSFIANNPYLRQKVPFPAEGGPVPLRRRVVIHLSRAIRMEPRQAVGYLSGKIWRYAPAEISAALRTLPGRLRSAFSLLAGELRWIALRVLGSPLPLDLIQRRVMGGFLDVTRRLLLAYTPGLYEGRIILFAAAQGQNPEPFWTGLAREGITVHRFPGQHLEMLEEPSVVETAALVSACLDPQRPVEPVDRRGSSRSRAGSSRPYGSLEVNSSGICAR